MWKVASLSILLAVALPFDPSVLRSALNMVLNTPTFFVELIPT